MKRTLLIIALLIFVVSTTIAQPGSIYLSSSNYRDWCCYGYDVSPGIVKIYAHHVYSPGAGGSKFSIDTWPSTLVYLGESSPFEDFVGNFFDGYTIDYGACMTTPFMVLEIQFFGMGTSPSCSFIRIIPSSDATTGEIEVMDCSDPPNILTTTGGDMIINPDGFCYSCGCDCDPDPVPAEQTNWGRIKALYLRN